MGAGNHAGGASADHSIDVSDTTGTATPHALPRAQAAHTARRAACLIELLSAQLTLAMAQQPSPPIPRGAPSARASADFTAQVMARLATPPPEPDPREARAKRMRAHVRRLAGVYLALVLVSGVALLALATLAPSLLLGLVA
ncbi:MAG TPA: hypothetical protein VIC27_12050, partial [Ktedonobacterales bacterium]